MKILYVTSEALPFASSGGLGEVAASLPKALRQRMVGCRVVLPLYQSVSQEFRDSMKFLCHITVPVAWRRQYCGIFEARVDGLIYYLLDNEYYFKRASLYGNYDDGERFAFLSRAVLEMLPQIDYQPDILHCNDWQTALTPVYLHSLYGQVQGYERLKTVYTIHNIQYQGIYGREILNDVFGLPEADFPLVAYDGDVNLMKGAIECAQAVTTVSPTYAQEILDPWFSHGLDPILRARSGKLSGILNGIDTQQYDPETDADIFCPYSVEHPAGKAENKAALQELFGLPRRPNVPVMGMVSRLVSHKGLDLLQTVLYELLGSTDLQLLVLGSGDWRYENFFRQFAQDFPEKLGLRLGFVPDLARKIYAGCDLFLMPSKSEPCGLSQMIALRYGTLPIVRETGGLKDTVTDSGDGSGNGFCFKSYNAYDMLDAVRRALAAYGEQKNWPVLVKRAMNCDNSWGASAREYIRLYKNLLQ